MKTLILLMAMVWSLQAATINLICDSTWHDNTTGVETFFHHRTKVKIVDDTSKWYSLVYQFDRNGCYASKCGTEIGLVNVPGKPVADVHTIMKVGAPGHYDLVAPGSGVTPSILRNDSSATGVVIKLRAGYEVPLLMNMYAYNADSLRIRVLATPTTSPLAK